MLTEVCLAAITTVGWSSRARFKGPLPTNQQPERTPRKPRRDLFVTSEVGICTSRKAPQHVVFDKCPNDSTRRQLQVGWGQIASAGPTANVKAMRNMRNAKQMITETCFTRTRQTHTLVNATAARGPLRRRRARRWGPIMSIWPDIDRVWNAKCRKCGWR